MNEEKTGTYFEEGRLDVGGERKEEKKICPFGVLIKCNNKCAIHDEVHNCCAILTLTRGK